MDFKCKNTKFSLYSIIIRVNYRSPPVPFPTGISFPKIMGNPCKIGEEILYKNIDLSITRCRIWTKTSMNEIIIGKTVRDYGKGENYQQA